MSIERTAIVGEPDAIEASGDDQRAWHDRYAGAMVVGIALVVVALTSVLTVRWFGGLDVIAPSGGGGATASSQTPGTILVGAQIVARDAEGTNDPQPVDIRSITPVVSENSADAEIVLLRCTGDETVGPDPLVGVELGENCRGAVPVGPGRMALDTQPPDKIMVLVTTRKPGVVRIDGFRVDYSLGIRSAVVVAGSTVEFTVGDGNVVTAPDDAVPTS